MRSRDSRQHHGQGQTAVRSPDLLSATLCGEKQGVLEIEWVQSLRECVCMCMCVRSCACAQYMSERVHVHTCARVYMYQCVHIGVHP